MVSFIAFRSQFLGCGLMGDATWADSQLRWQLFWNSSCCWDSGCTFTHVHSRRNNSHNRKSKSTGTNSLETALGDAPPPEAVSKLEPEVGGMELRFVESFEQVFVDALDKIDRICQEAQTRRVSFTASAAACNEAAIACCRD